MGRMIKAISCAMHDPPVGAAAGCDLLILIFGEAEIAEDQKIAAFGSSYIDRVHR
ncbi:MULTISPECIES: hypothetical protein [Pseudomonas]|jgi:hypothetical protein|uniref:hypothetical protein n=1 Tax=Pseudomonas TaxID=286 RepID=UPI0012E2D8DF|nr:MULTISPECIES: hypothetical protein [Pseudomonas]NSX12371.1 hypothetical protein [Pseudomonas lini]